MKNRWIVEEDNEFMNRPTYNYVCPECKSCQDEPTNFCPDCGERLINMNKYSCKDCDHFKKGHYTDPWGFTEDDNKCELHEWDLDDARNTTCDDNTEEKARNGANFRKVDR